MLLLALTGSIATGKSTTARILTSAPYSLPLLDADVIAREVIEPGTRAYWRIREEFEASTPGLLLEDDASGESSQEEGSNVGKGSQNQSEESKRRSQSWISWFSSLPSALLSLLSLLSTNPSLKNPSPPLPRINRATLGRCVFGSSPSATSRRHTLNSIIHPSVRFRLLTSILKHYLGGTRVLLLDIPLLYESSLDILAGYILFVAASPEVQKRRLLVRDRAMGKEISEGEAEGRIASQVAVREKVEWMEEMMGRKWGGDGGGGGGGGVWGAVVWNDGEGEEELRREIERVGVGELVKSAREGWWGLWLRGSPLGAVIIGGWVVGRNWLKRSTWRRRRERGKEGKGQ